MDKLHLISRNGCWHLNFSFPADFHDKALAGRRVRLTLRTADLRTAQKSRDRLIGDLLAIDNELAFLDALIRKYVAGKDRLQRKLREVLPEFGLRNVPAAGQLTLGGLCSKFLEHLARKGSAKPISVARYKSALDCVRFVIGDARKVEELARDDFVRFCDNALRLPVGWNYRRGKGLEAILDAADESQTRKLSKGSVRNDLVIAKQMWSWARESGLVHADPIGKLGSLIDEQKQKSKRPPTLEEAASLCRLPAPRSDQYPVAWRFMPLLARYTGCRAGELAQLTRDSVVTRDGVRCLSIAGDLKTESSRRLVPVSDRLAPHLDELLELREGVEGRLVEECDWSSGGVVKYAHAFLKLYNNAAKKVARDLSFHCWRAYANTEMARHGVDVIDRERLLGHVNDRTNAVYTADDMKRFKRAVDFIP